MDIICMGEPLVEFSEVSKEGGRFYLPGYGGDTSNVAIAASRHGAKTAYLTRVGTDAFGQQFLELWESEGVDTSLVQIDAHAHTGIYFITYTERGHEFTYLRKGSAASRMNPEMVPEDAIAKAKLLHISGISQAISESSCDAVFRAIEVARKHKTMVSYDPNLRLKLWPLSRAKAVIHETIRMTDIFLPSLEDVQQLSGLEGPTEILEKYLNFGVDTISLKLGKSGVLIASGSSREMLPGHAVQSIDSTGAGDTFDGAFLTRIIAGDTVLEAARYANAAAALSTTGYGAVLPIPNKNQVEEFLQQAGNS